MTRNEKIEWGLAIVVAAVLLYFLLRKTTTATAAPLVVGAAPPGSNVTSTITGWTPTQLGMPLEMIQALTYQQVVSDVQFFVDPASSLLIPNTAGLVNGNVPIVALSADAQILLFYNANPAAVQDLDVYGLAPAGVQDIQIAG